MGRRNAARLSALARWTASSVGATRGCRELVGAGQSGTHRAPARSDPGRPNFCPRSRRRCARLAHRAQSGRSKPSTSKLAGGLTKPKGAGRTAARTPGLVAATPLRSCIVALRGRCGPSQDDTGERAFRLDARIALGMDGCTAQGAVGCVGSALVASPGCARPRTLASGRIADFPRTC